MITEYEFKNWTSIWNLKTKPQKPNLKTEPQKPNLKTEPQNCIMFGRYENYTDMQTLISHKWIQVMTQKYIEKDKTKQFHVADSDKSWLWTNFVLKVFILCPAVFEAK